MKEKYKKDGERQSQRRQEMKEKDPERYKKILEKQRLDNKERYELQKAKLMSDPEAYEAFKIKERERGAKRRAVKAQSRNLTKKAPVKIALLGKRKREERSDGRALEQASEVRRKRIRQESLKGSEQ